MSQRADTAPTESVEPDTRLALLLAMAMFVLVVDTSLMNVSISAVVGDLNTTVSSIQAAISLEALVSAAFILIGSKVGDLIGRRRAYVLGLLGYAIGALSMAFAQGVIAIVVFWAIVGGLGASLLLPAMQALIHGNFQDPARRKVYALVGASAAIAAAVGPLIGGFITTFLSWRVGFLLEVVVIAIVLSNIKRVRDVPYTGPRQVDVVGSVLSVIGMGGIVLGILSWQEGGEAVAALIVSGGIALALLGRWLVRRKRDGKPTLLDPDLFRSAMFRFGITGQMMQQIALGGAMIALPIFMQMVLGYDAMATGLTIAPLSLTMFAVALLAGKRAGRRRPSRIIRAGFGLLALGMALLIVVVPRADSGWSFLIPLIVAGAGLGLLVSQLNNFTLAPISDERSSEAAGVNSAAGSFGLSFGLAFAGADHARDPLGRLHRHGRAERRPDPRRAAAGRGRARRGRRGDERRAARGAPRRPARGRAGRDHPHQHRGAADRAPGGAARAVPGRPARADHVPADDAAPRPRPLELDRGDGGGVTVADAGKEVRHVRARPERAHARGAPHEGAAAGARRLQP